MATLAQQNKSLEVVDDFVRGNLASHLETMSAEEIKAIITRSLDERIQANYTLSRLTPTSDGKDFILEFRAIPAYAKE